MTYKEKYGTFENYQRQMAESAIKANEEVLNTPYSHFSIDCHMRDSEIKERYAGAKKAIEHLKKLVSGEIEDPLYRAYWDQMIAYEERAYKNEQTRKGNG